MKKTMKSTILLAAALLGMLFTNCQRSGDTPLYQAIPSDVALLYSLRVDQILDKSGVINNFLPMAESMLEGNEEGQFLIDILKDVNTMGIDLSDIVFFIANDGGGPNGAVVARLTDRLKFTDFLGHLAETGMVINVEKKEGFYQAGVDDNLLIFNDHLLIATQSIYGETLEQAAARVRALFTQAKEKSILGNDKFTQAFNTTDALLAYVNLAPFSRDPGFKQMLTLTGMDISSVSGIMGISFPDGAMRMTTRVLSIDSALLQTQGRPLTLSLLDYIPAAPAIATAILNMDGQATYDNMQKSLTNFLTLAAMNGGFPAPTGGMLQAFGLLQSINGEVMLNIASGTPYPAATLYAEVKDNRPLDALNEWLSEGPFQTFLTTTKLADNIYRAEVAPLRLSVYYGIKDGRFFISNDEALKAHPGDKLDNSFKNTPVAKRVPAGASGYFLLDISNLIQPIAFFANMRGGGGISPALMADIDQFQYLEAYSIEDGKEVVLQLELKDKTKNVLKLTSDMAFKALETFTSSTYQSY
ncbi:MAG: DUF4836 family protein [Odoribacteraceae bacterium]|jgi:hypothetical protein|nr:DUF4836 family protein [Odoribacteraceae bacterium]